MRLLLFNPDTEYALATGASFYTPPAVISTLAESRQLLPEAWARPDDVILVNDRSLTSRFRLADWDSIGDIVEEFPDIRIEPWGWNHALRRKLLDHGVPDYILPSVEWLDTLRTLAHRRTTVLLNSKWNDIAPHCMRVPVPEELFSEQECVDFLSGNPGCWMKAPWSSSGRGVINTAADMNECHVRPWCRGIIRRQGSVLAEIGADRVADFATEWHMSGEGEARYLGLSSFLTSRRGKYISNNSDSRQMLEDGFGRLSSMPLARLLELQKRIVENVLCGYRGLFGIDVIVERSGKLRPFVEVNLRRTMGMLYLPEIP